MVDNKRPASRKNESAQEESPHNFSAEDKEKLLDAFDVFDENNDGVIDKYELKKILEAVSETDHIYEEDEVIKIMNTVDSSGDGKIQKDEFLQLLWSEMESNKPGEPFVELFKSFGAKGGENDIITQKDFADALEQEGEKFNQEELNMIFQELAGYEKRQDLPPANKYERSMGITFNDFMVLMLPK